MPRTNYVTQWFSYADDDLVAGDLLIKGDGPIHSICFHSQQAAEKYLKGFLAFYGRNIRKSHDLESLLDECEDIDTSFSGLRDVITHLGQFYVETRYPGDYPEFTLDECRKARKSAIRVKEFVLEKTKE